MTKLRDVMAYICQKYPHPAELSKARLTKLVYLSDWRNTLQEGDQITGINWKFNHFGPYVDDVYQLAVEDPHFNVERETNMYGNLKERISLKTDLPVKDLARAEVAAIDHVIEETRRLNWNEFIQLVYSTFPVVSGTRGALLDLKKAAREYSESGLRHG